MVVDEISGFEDHSPTQCGFNSFVIKDDESKSEKKLWYHGF